MANNKFCIECRFELPITAKFCERCGFTFVLNESTSESEPEIKQDKQPSTQPVTEIPTEIKDFIKSKINEGWSDAKIQSSVKAKYGIDEIFKQSSTRKKSRGNRMDFLTSLKVCHTKYADFEGTASRSEYWWFYLYTWLLIPFCFIPYVQILFIIIALTTVIPYMAVAVRRMHDLNYSGWRILWGLIPLLGSILLIVWYSKEGNLNKDDEVKIEEEEEEIKEDEEDEIEEEINKEEIGYNESMSRKELYSLSFIAFLVGIVVLIAIIPFNN